MDILGIVILIAVVWYFATRDGDGSAAPRVGPSPRHCAPRSPDHRPTTAAPPADGPRTIASPFAQQIQAAIDAGRDIHFRYSDAKGSVTCRTIRPHRFVEFEFTRGEGRSLCVEGHCRLRDESRTFALRRMSDLETLRGPHRSAAFQQQKSFCATSSRCDLSSGGAWPAESGRTPL